MFQHFLQSRALFVLLHIVKILILFKSSKILNSSLNFFLRTHLKLFLQLRNRRLLVNQIIINHLLSFPPKNKFRFLFYFRIRFRNHRVSHCTLRSSRILNLILIVFLTLLFLQARCLFLSFNFHLQSKQ